MASQLQLLLLAFEQWGMSSSVGGYAALCMFPISFTTTNYVAIATGSVHSEDATYGKENYVNNFLWDMATPSGTMFRLSHADRPTLKYIAVGY